MEYNQAELWAVRTRLGNEGRSRHRVAAEVGPLRAQASTGVAGSVGEWQVCG